MTRDDAPFDVMALQARVKALEAERDRLTSAIWDLYARWLNDGNRRNRPASADIFCCAKELKALLSLEEAPQ